MTENRTLGDFGDPEGDDEDGGESTPGESNPDITADADADNSAEATAEDPAAPADESTDGVAPAASDEAADFEESDAPAAAIVTYAWSPDGDACGECGETVEKRWRAGEGVEDPDALVCEACKEW